MDTGTLISVIIPVKNGDPWLEELFQKLQQQTLFSRSEIIVIDSGSNDRSLDIISKYPVKLIQIPGSAFNHGETRNLGVREAKGKYVVMTVQDAVPVSDLWLQYLVDGFENEKVAAVCGQQVVRHDLNKNPVLWFRPVSQPGKTFYHFETPEDLLKLDPATQRQRCTLDNVVTAYRRDILLQFPFAKVEFAEDISWAKEILLKGFTLAQNTNASVYHYHHYLPEFVLSRYFAVFYAEYCLFKLLPRAQRPVTVYILVTLKILVRERAISWREKFKWLIFNTRYRYALEKTISIFIRAQKKGDAFLYSRYQEICKQTPQAPKY
jgi:rhamnosyltransferase